MESKKKLECKLNLHRHTHMMDLEKHILCKSKESRKSRKSKECNKNGINWVSNARNVENQT